MRWCQLSHRALNCIIEQGPLKPFYNAGKLIPWVVNPFLKLNAVFMHGLVMDALLNVSFLGPGLHFALSSTSQWGMQDGLFSLLDFDYNITALFSPSSQWAEETLASWDKKFFNRDGTIISWHRQLPPPPNPGSDIVWLQQARHECELEKQH
ncbi:hypothetical protein E4T56_gene557 [Termitomyces sp. T112]|nr:hypothetical protein E4T56_gene557 [Termitomyces sp. T112]